MLVVLPATSHRLSTGYFHLTPVPKAKPQAAGYYLLSTIYYLLSTIYYLLSTIYYLLSTIYYLLSTIYCLLSTIHYPLSHYPLFTIYCPLSAVCCRLSNENIAARRSSLGYACPRCWTNASAAGTPARRPRIAAWRFIASMYSSIP